VIQGRLSVAQNSEDEMKTITIIFASLCLASAASAQTAPAPGAAAGADCKKEAAGVHAGAPFNSKVTSCCKQQAAKRNLHGAPEKSFIESCEKTAHAT
jgi:hypothetical protein